MTKKETSSLKTLWRLLSFTKGCRGRFVMTFVFAVLAVILQLAVPILVGDAVDCMLGPGEVDLDRVLQYVIWLIPVVAGGAFFQYLMSLCANSLTYNTVRSLRENAFARLSRMPLSYIDTHPHGDLIARVASDIEIIADGMLQGMTQLFSGIVTVLTTIIFMFLLNWVVALVVVVLTPVSLFVAAFIARGSHKYFTAQAASRGELSGFCEESLGGMNVVRAFSHEERAQGQFEEINSRLYKCGLKAQIYSALVNPSTRFLNYLVYAAVGLAGGLIAVLMPSLGAVGGAYMTAGKLSTFLMYSNQYTKPFNEITGVLSEMQNAMAAARRVFDMMDKPVESDDSALPALPGAQGRIDIDEVSFSYTPERPLITCFDLHVKPGQRIAIVGPTGCGKTTFINLLMRFYDVNGGSIKVDGHDIRKVTRHSLRQNYGMILQDTWLFNGTIRENIAYGKPDATEEEIVQAAKLASCDTFIMQFKDGYDTVIDEDSLSQGQRQLLCIARVMLTRPPMLILDEATSSIDTRTEMKIQKAFAYMMQGRTSFIVAHRLSTIRTADLILVMKDGNIIEQGTHTQLLEKKGFYSELYNSQFAE